MTQPPATAADRAARHQGAATLALLSGDPETAEGAYRRSLAGYRAADDYLGQVDALENIAFVTGHLERLDDAMAAVDEALRICDAHGEQFERGFLLCYRGDLLWRLGRTEESLAALRSTLSSWSVLRPVTTGGALMLIARSLASDGRHRRAAALLGARTRLWEDFGIGSSPLQDNRYGAIEDQVREALGAEEFQEAHDEGYAMSLSDAARLAIGEEPPPSAPAPTAPLPVALSARERQVAALLACGCSNKQIAAELMISTRTAEGHVAKVMDKLGVHSRDEVALRLGPTMGVAQE